MKRKPAEEHHPKGLCFRCEHRATFLETGKGFRYECGQIKQQTYGCYAFRPTNLLVVSKLDPTDIRPMFGGMVGSRIKPDGFGAAMPRVKALGKGRYVVYLVPRGCTKKRKGT